MSKVRDAILNSCQPNYCKVDMIVVRASELLGDDSTVTYEAIGDEIAKLVEQGLIQAVGDISNWRRSEVRLPCD